MRAPHLAKQHSTSAYPTFFALLLTLASATHCSHSPSLVQGDPSLKFGGESHLENIRQLTHGGTNAEAYFSFDGSRLVFQHKGPFLGAQGSPTEPGPACDQIYSMKADGSELKMLSNGKGRTTCAYFLPGDERVVFSSTHATSDSCPPPPDMSHGYVWAAYSSYLTYSVKKDGQDLVPFEAGQPRAYNAETTVCRDGSVVFTSDRDGDLELYVGKIDKLGSLGEIKRITHEIGYDGGAVFSPDCKKIAWRASRPRGAEVDEYRSLLKQHLVKPGKLEIWIADADGAHARQLTRLGVASFAPAFAPDGKRILFSSNPSDPNGRSFDLYSVNTDGTHLEQVTHSETFDSFPMFSPDGKQLVFASSRNGTEPHETNVFLADWVETPQRALSMDDAEAEDRFMATVARLSAPEMEGRGPGTPGAAKAEDLVAARFEALGLKPFAADALKQPLEMTVGNKQDRHVVTANNVIGAWGPGCSIKGMNPVIIGAHLDHLGHGGDESLEPTKQGIHPGADDNASGVAAMLEVARIITRSTVPAAAAKSRRDCYVFAAFAGEEVSIAGSSRFAGRLKEKGIRPKAMLNLDMVGRMEKNHLIAFGSDSAKEWRAVLDEECGREGLVCDGGGDGYGPSDHMAFYVNGAPVLHFFTGPHADYHRTTDTADKINATGGVQAAELVAIVAMRAASPKQKLTYVKPSKVPTMGAVTGNGGRKGNGAYLGTIPDYATLSSPRGPGGGGEPQGGVRLAGVRSGSPAEKAGVREGDVLAGIEFPPGNNQAVGTLEEFMGVLLTLHPGDDIVLHVRRASQSLKLPAKVGKR
jgi:Tol biopolymer transport system component